MKVCNPVKGSCSLVHGFLDDQYEQYHNAVSCGVVLSVEQSTDVLAIASGKVVYVGTPSGYRGLTVIVSGDDSKLYRYCNLDTAEVYVEDSVKAGDLLGVFGEGVNNSMNKCLCMDICHTNLDILKWPVLGTKEDVIKNYVDPVEFLRGKGIELC